MITSGGTVSELQVPPWLYDGQTPEKPQELDPGDRGATSMIIAVYSYQGNVWTMKRYTQVLASQVQALLIKRKIYDPAYQALFNEIWTKWREARLLLTQQEDHGIADCLFSRIETVLKIIAEREHLTKNSSEVYNAKLSMPAQEPMAAEADLYAL